MPVLILFSPLPAAFPEARGGVRTWLSAPLFSSGRLQSQVMSFYCFSFTATQQISMDDRDDVNEIITMTNILKDLLYVYFIQGLPWWISKESACSAEDAGLIWVRKVPWRRASQPTPVFLPRESQGQKSLEGYSLKGHKESDMTEATEHARIPHIILTIIDTTDKQIIATIMPTTRVPVTPLDFCSSLLWRDIQSGGRLSSPSLLLTHSPLLLTLPLEWVQESFPSNPSFSGSPSSTGSGSFSLE